MNLDQILFVSSEVIILSFAAKDYISGRSGKEVLLQSMFLSTWMLGLLKFL